MAFTLPSLPYDVGALEPHIDAKTMEIHHGKHHQTYVTNLNAALEKAPELASKSIDDIMRSVGSAPEAVRTAIRNNGGGHWNHSMFWQIMAPGSTSAGQGGMRGGGEPGGSLAGAIGKSFGDVAKFKEEWGKAAAARFGSGWVWLMNEGGKLSIISTPNQDNPLMDGKPAPILGLDVWEHAYYLKYQNRRPDYVTAWWNVVNWAEVQKRFGR
ncbi:MAG: superoxide dismutase [Gemmatimonadota bacterium]|nr:superoxide dismutase [Gemmatimonadota bacterium]